MKKLVRVCMLLFILVFLYVSSVAAEEALTEKPQIPLGLDRFILLIEKQDNPYLGLNIFHHTID